jgi:hypothetical protein
MTNEKKMLHLAEENLRNAIKYAKEGDKDNAVLAYGRLNDLRKKFYPKLFEFVDPNLAGKHEALMYYRDKKLCHTDLGVHDVQDGGSTTFTMPNGKEVIAEATLFITQPDSIKDIESYVMLMEFQLKRIMEWQKEVSGKN